MGRVAGEVLPFPTTSKIRRMAVSSMFAQLRRAAVPLPGANEMLGQLRGMGLGIRRTDFLKGYRETVGHDRKIQAQLRREPDELIPLSEMPVPEFPPGEMYRYQFEIECYQYEMDEWGRKDFFIESPDHLTAQDAFAKMQASEAAVQMEDYGIHWQTADFRGVTRRVSAE